MKPRLSQQLPAPDGAKLDCKPDRPTSLATLSLLQTLSGSSARERALRRWCRVLPTSHWAPETGEVDHLAPFQVSERAGRHVGSYEDEPQVLAEIEPDISTAYFEAHWQG